MRNPWKLTSIALATLLAASIGSGAINRAFAEPQPKMKDALESLKSARDALEAATPDKGGHRKKAIELTRSAITQVEEGIKFDNRH